MSGHAATKLAQLIIALVVMAIVLITIRIKTGKPWSVIHRDSDHWFSRQGKLATFVVLVVIFAIFMFVNNGFFR
jgi:uncharacterized membrane protein